jgi:hypothetical protein
MSYYLIFSNYKKFIISQIKIVSLIVILKLIKIGKFN